MKFAAIVDIPNDCIRSLNWNAKVEVQTGILTHSYETRLKPLPQKKVGDDLYERYGSWTLNDEKEVSYRVGFNDCINEILGEEE